jgi:predicted nuclease of predicted toxin-antitoxin system
MRLIADENFPKSVVELLRAAGADMLWARTDCRGWTDTALLDFAESEKRILLTLDKDFWQIAVQRRIPLEHSGVILFRVHPAIDKNIEPLVRKFFEADRVWAGNICIISTAGIQSLAAQTGRKRH